MATASDQMPLSEDAEDATGTMIASSGTFRLPSFWSTEPALWFLQAESQFANRGITSQKTRYHHVVSALSVSDMAEVRDVLRNIPQVNPYDALKSALIGRLTTSEQQRLQQLLASEELGDRRPTQLLRRMKQLLGEDSSADDGLFRELFLQRLPRQVRMILAASSDQTVDKLAELADRVTEGGSPGIPREMANVVAQTSVSCPTSDDYRTRIERLECMMARLQPVDRSPSPRQHRGLASPPLQPRRRPSTSYYNQAPSGPCWFHQRFGGAARNCRPPCSWTGNAMPRR